LCGTAARDLGPTARVIPLTFGHVLRGTLGAGETETYGFTAGAGDRIIIRMCRLMGTLNPEVQLRDPDGGNLQTNWSAGKTEVISGALPVSGTYFVAARDYWGTNEGEYSLVLVRIHPPDDISISFGQTVSGTLTAGDMKRYAFRGAAGDRMRIRMIQTSEGSPLYPQIRLYDPEGLKLAEEWAPSETEIGIFVLPNTGIYAILVSDYYGTFTGEYVLIVERFTTPVPPEFLRDLTD
jgi:hypothetical protein